MTLGSRLLAQAAAFAVAWSGTCGLAFADRPEPPASTTSTTTVSSPTTPAEIEPEAAPPPDTPTPFVPGVNDPIVDPKEPGIDWGRLLLDLPGAFVELAFTPVLVTAHLAERYHVVERLLDVFTNDERTFAVLPLIEPFSRSGIGFGGLAAWNEPLGSPDRLILIALGRVNGDFNVSVEAGRRLPFVRGRAITARFAAFVDNDARFFGLGDQQSGTETLLRRDGIDAELRVSLLSPAIPVLTAEAGVAYRRRRIDSGEGSEPSFEPGVPVNGELLRPPAGFGQTLDYPELAAQFGVDTRNSFGLTSRGIILRTDGIFTHDVNGAGTGGARLSADFASFIPVLLRHRTLYLRAGFASAVPFSSSEQVPFHILPNLGGPSTLRGYPPDRFIDELAWWATIEYRWFFYEWAGTGGGLVGTVFADFGNVGANFEDLFEGRLPWSAGLSVRVEQSLIMLGRLQVGFSPEGVMVTFGIGDLL